MPTDASINTPSRSRRGRSRSASSRGPGRLAAMAGLWTLTALLTAGSGGCVVGELVGGMIESHRRNSTLTVKAEYTGLTGKSFAVVVAADRLVQADYPEVIAKLTVDVSERLAKFSGAAGYVPGQLVLDYQYGNPRWVTMTPSQLAQELGVERLVYIDLAEYRLHDPGNQYLWQGTATGTVGVIEADSALPDEFVFTKSLKLNFPDNPGATPTDLPRAAVNTALANRFVDRSSWLFYDHEEPYYPDY